MKSSKKLRSIAVFSLVIFNFSLVNSQEILWEKTLGGEHSEYLYDMKATPDYGFILAGSSLSEDSGNKQEASKGDLDYLLWKLNEDGITEWQKSFGGEGQDYLYSVQLTKDGGFILGGSTTTGKNGDKTTENFGLEDYWVLKLSAKGDLEWQQSYGGMGQDKLLSVQQTQDGGYILGGSSDSDKYLTTDNLLLTTKQENSRGNQDYWVIKTDSEGKIEWQKTIGGEYYDLLRSIEQTQDGGYILGGYSNSGISGDKTDENKGIGDYWILKLTQEGNIEWQQTLGGSKDDQLYSLHTTPDGGYIVGGNSNSPQSEDKAVSNQEGTDFWVLKLDEKGNINWQQTYNIGSSDILLSILPSVSLSFGEGQGEEISYLIAGYSQSEHIASNENQKARDKEGINDYIALKIDEKGKELWRKAMGGSGTDQLQVLAETRDGGYLLAGTSDSFESENTETGQTGKGQNDFYIVKLLDKDKPLQERISLEMYPNPTDRFVNVLINETIKGEGILSLVDMNGVQLQQHKAENRTIALDLGNYPPGVYLLHVQVNGKEETFKVLKKGNK